MKPYQFVFYFVIYFAFTVAGAVSEALFRATVVSILFLILIELITLKSNRGEI